MGVALEVLVVAFVIVGTVIIVDVLGGKELGADLEIVPFGGFVLDLGVEVGEGFVVDGFLAGSFEVGNFIVEASFTGEFAFGEGCGEGGFAFGEVGEAKEEH